MKIFPTYTLNVETQGGTKIAVGFPYSCEFEINRASASSSQTGTFRLFNLAKETRDRIQKDWFTTADIRALQFSAGYDKDSPLPLLFNGTVKQAYSYRQGQNQITEIQGWDGASAMANGYSLRSVAGGAAFSDLIKNLASDLPGLGGAIVGQFTGRTARGAVFAGNTWNYILQLSDGLAIIDNNRLIALNQNEVLQAEIPVITSASGLLESPRRANAMIKVPILFEPRLTVGQIVELRSSTNPVYDGAYKVMGFVHRGIISPAVDGERRTEVTLWDGVKNAGGFTYADGSAVTLPL